MQDGFQQLGLSFIPSYANFVLVNVRNGEKVFQSLQKLGIITRPMSKDLGEYLRISIGTENENEKVLGALKIVLNESMA